MTIERVTLKKLEKSEGDRRGLLAVFKLVIVPNMPYVQTEAIKYIQCLYGAFGYNLYEQHQDQIGKPGEQADSFLYINANGCEIWIGHKYWEDEQITAFRRIVEALAPVHHWEVVKEY